MTKNHFLSLFILSFLWIGMNDIHAQRRKKRKEKERQEQLKKKNENKNGIQPYEKVITKKAKTDHGLFHVHQIEQDYFYEIPDTLFHRDMLMVTRIAKTMNGIGFGGGKSNSQVVRWEKKNNQILLRIASFENYAADSLPIHQAVVNSNFNPILYSFDIKAISKDSANYVIDATGLYSDDVIPLGLPATYRERFKVKSLDKKRSLIERITSYPLNIESRHIKTYSASKAPSDSYAETISVEMSNSMILLPKTPMKKRFFDPRVGWFARKQIDYGSSAQKSKTYTYLDRWKLEVKDEDLEKFKRGELVEPKKPIVYYIDRATPEEWRKYLKQGIEDWQIAFEAAGFKNAIIAKDPPTKEENPEWSPEDVRFSVMRYLASPIPNANGPHTSDPRSGEILQSNINWYHNVMTLLHNWYFVQTAAINPEARTNEFKTSLMGELIRFVSAHEVGHTLGLPHNMAASFAYPVDSLRSASFTQKYNTAPSIMDYARFNYVAQPEDKGVKLMPGIGIYDKYAIHWGYAPILEAKTAKDEKPILDQWILKHAGDPNYRFGQQRFEILDPSAQTEDLGNNAVKASTYGIANLKRIVPNLIDWTYAPGEQYTYLDNMYKQVLTQYNRYMGHVVSNIGGVYEYYHTYNQQKPNYIQVDAAFQKKAMEFLQKELFATPEWLINQDIFDKIEAAGTLNRIQAYQITTLEKLLSFSKIARLIENKALNGKKAYGYLEMMTDLRKGIWSEVNSGKSVDAFRRNLQLAYLNQMERLLTQKQDKVDKEILKYTDYIPISVKQTDVRSVVYGELNTLKSQIKRNLSRSGNTMTIYHYQFVIEKIDQLLDPNQK